MAGGRGAYSCIAATAPVFLSEDEARQVIVDEGIKAGIIFTPDVATGDSICYPITAWTPNSIYQAKAGTSQRPLILDGLDQKRQIGYEFVSRSDYEGWVDRLGPLDQVQDFDLRGSAEIMRNAMQQAQPSGSYAVFYDPAVDDYSNYKYGQRFPLFLYSKLNDKYYPLSRQELRAQVKDFIQWLKVQGVI